MTTYAKIAVRNADIRIVHSLAIFEMRDRSPTNCDRHAPLRAIPQPHRNGNHKDDPTYYTSPMAMGKRKRHAITSMWVATQDQI